MSEQLSRKELLRQKRDYWKRHIESWQGSSLTQTEYCQQHNLKNHQFVYWKKRFVQTETGVKFVPLNLGSLMSKRPSQSDSSVRLVFDHGLKVEVDPGFNPQLLRQIIMTLKGL